MQMKSLAQASPRAILAGTFLLFLGPFLLVELFPIQLDRVMDKSSYLVFHNIAEFFSIMVSLSVFGIGWFTYNQSKDRHALFLGAAFLAVGLLDFMHTMSNAAMPDFITPNSTNKSTQLWIIARLFDASAFLASAYIYPDNKSRCLARRPLLMSVLIFTGLVFIGVVFFPSYLPATAIPGIGLTPLKRYLELFVMFMLAAAAVAYWRRLQLTGDRTLLYYPAAFIICIFSEGVFASYKTGYDTYNVLGHIYKVAAFFLIYKGVFIASVMVPYNKLTNEDKLRHLASFPQLNPNPVIELDFSGNVIFANPAVESVLESPEMDKGKVAVFLPHDLDVILQGTDNNNDLPIYREVTVGNRVFSETIQLIPQFRVVRIYALDITERKRAEEVSQRAREEWERTFASVPDMIAILDNNHRIIRVNAAMAQKLGLRPEECIGLPCYEYVHGLSGPPSFCPHSRTMQDGCQHIEEVHEERLGGDFLVSTTPLCDEQGQMIGSVHVAHDITLRKISEEEIKSRIEELKTANTELARFNAAAVGRELRMIELKKEINELCKKAGLGPRYSLDLGDEG